MSVSISIKGITVITTKNSDDRLTIETNLVDSEKNPIEMEFFVPEKTAEDFIKNNFNEVDNVRRIKM